MPDLRWLVGEPMSDEVPDSAGGAVRAFLGALGFIVALIGAEMMAEKAGDRVWIGLALIAASLPIFLSAFMWKQFRQRLGTLFADRLVAIANDPRWWIISFFLALFSMRLVMFGADFPWITAGIIVVLICLIAWGYFSTRNNQIQGRPANAASGSTLAPSKDPQIERDTLLLLDFAVNHSTVKMLDALLMVAPQMPPYDRTFILRDDFEATHQACLDFVRHVGIKLDRGSHRHSSFLSLMQSSENDAERIVEETPPEQRPTAVDVLTLRRQAIAYLKCVSAIAFLQYQKKEVEERIVNQRDSLLERLRMRDS